MRLCDVGETIQEVMESYEVEIDGKTYQGNMRSLIIFPLCAGSTLRPNYETLVFGSYRSEAHQKSQWPLHWTVPDTLREDGPYCKRWRGHEDGGLCADVHHFIS